MLRVVVLRVLFFVDMRLPVFSVADLYCRSCFYVKLMVITQYDNLGVIIDYLTWF